MGGQGNVRQLPVDHTQQPLLRSERQTPRKALNESAQANLNLVVINSEEPPTASQPLDTPAKRETPDRGGSRRLAGGFVTLEECETNKTQQQNTT